MSNASRPRTLLAALAVAAALVAGCGPSLPPLSNVTSLSCPDPGLLPFRLDSYSFADAANAMLVKDETRNKDEASDTLGQPSGARANIYIDDAATPAAGDIVYHGKMAVTSPDQGLFTDGVPNEKVSLWSYDSGAWKALGRTTTDGSGYYDLTPSPAFTAANGTPVYAVLEGNGSCAAHFDWLYPSGTKAVVFDIDGTLTTSDDELLMQLSDGSYTPAMMTAANTMVQAWAHKGYTIVYLTARAHTFRAETRGLARPARLPARAGDHHQQHSRRAGLQDAVDAAHDRRLRLELRRRLRQRDDRHRRLRRRQHSARGHVHHRAQRRHVGDGRHPQQRLHGAPRQLRRRAAQRQLARLTAR